MLNYALFWKLIAALYFKRKSRPAGNVSSVSYGTKHEWLGGGQRKAWGIIFFLCSGNENRQLGTDLFFCTPQISVGS
jgi:hypothetical protein